jgi:hypothetical protein
MDKIQFTDLMLEGATGPVETTIPEFEGAKFLLSPVSTQDKERLLKQHKICPICGGYGVVPTSTGKCPRCHSREGLPSYKNPEICLAVLTEIMHGWSNLLTVEGTEIPYEPKWVERLFASDSNNFFTILQAASNLYMQRRQVEEGN